MKDILRDYAPMIVTVCVVAGLLVGSVMIGVSHAVWLR